MVGRGVRRRGRELSESDVPEGDGGDGEDDHEPGWHELFGFGEAHGEDNEQDAEKQINEVIRPWYCPGRRQSKDGGEGHGHNEGDFAAGLEEAGHSAHHEEDDVNPENLSWVGHIVISRGDCDLVRADIQAQNFAGFGFHGDFERAAADLAIGGESL